MPAVIVPIAAAAGGTAIGALVGTGVGAAIVTAVSSVVIASALDRMLFGKPRVSDAAQGMEGRTVTVSASDETRKILYGETRVGGSYAFFNNRDDGGLKSDYVWYIVVFGDHALDEFSTLWIENRPIDVETEIDSNSLVTAPAFVNRDGAKLVQIRRHAGTQTVVDGTLDTQLSQWNLEHVGRDVAYAAFRLQVDRSKATETDPDASVWAEGWPQSFSATLRGKAVYDPRDPTQDVDDPDTWKWSNNPALCVADYLRDVDLGFGEDFARIDYVSFAAAATACDEPARVYNAAGTGFVEQAKFTLNGVVDTAMDHGEILDMMLSSCMGRLLIVEGMYQLRVGTWIAPVLALTEADCIGEQEFMPRSGQRELFNTVVGTYVHQLRDYERVSFAEQTDASYVADDPGPEDRDIELPLTDDEYRAQWIARLALRQSRMRATYAGGFTMAAAALTAEDNITYSNSYWGFVDKTFRILTWEMRHSDRDGDYVYLTMVEDDVDAYEMDDHTQLTVYEPAQPLTVYDAVPPLPTNLAAVGDSRGIVTSWSNPGNVRDIQGVRVLRSSTSGGTYEELTTTLGEQYIDPVVPGQTAFYKIQSVGLSGKASALVGPVSAESHFAAGDSTNSGAANLIPDPDFTRSRTGIDDDRFWILGPSPAPAIPRAEIVDGIGISGKRALRLSHGASLGAQASVVAAESFPAHKGQFITISASARVTTGSGAMIFQLLELDADGVATSLTQVTTDVLTGSFKDFTETIEVADADTVAIKLTIFDALTSNDVMTVNDVSAWYTVDVSGLAGGAGNIDGGRADTEYGGGSTVDGGTA